MKPLFLTILFSIGICLSGCQTPPTVQPKINEAVSVAVYATNDSMTAGRFDLAQKYSNQAVRLVPPPSKRVVVKGVYE